MRRALLLGRAVLVSLAAAVVVGGGLAAADDPAPASAAFFSQRVAPLLESHCAACHGAEKQEGGLRLDGLAGLSAGGATGAAIVPGSAAESLLFVAVSRVDDALAMPPEGKLAEADVAAIRAWIDAGAPHPDGPLTVPVPVPPFDPVEKRRFWSLTPPQRPLPPAVRDAALVATPIDAFVIARLDEAGIVPAAVADPATLLRRASLVLTGLPPTPDEVDAFLADPAADAWDKAVERLLASPRYGEHQARHWLDVVRYADSNGLDENIAHGNAWRYRDWVIAAFNRDEPFDAFLRAHVAGDLLVTEGMDEARRAELLTATGFLAMGPKVLAEGDQEKLLADIVDEQIDTVGKAFLGLSFGCARCHDHKFDPVSQADYYALAGVFKSTTTMESLARIAKWHENDVATAAERAALAAGQERVAAHQRSIDALLAETRTSLAAAAQSGVQGDGKSDGQTGAAAPPPAEIPEERFPEEARVRLAALREELKGLEAALPAPATAMGVREGMPEEARVALRGSHLAPGRRVPRGVPAVLEIDRPLAVPAAGSGRRELADWLVDPRHPLTARVFVNRVWRWHFGRGIVPTPDNFGFQGEAPTNQPLLDWLACEFVASGWSVKHLHRLILASRVWRSSSAPTASPTRDLAEAVDPAAERLWRFPLRRLEAESVRDATLAVSGLLDTTMGGSMLHVANRAFLFDHTSIDGTKYDSPRRSIYLPVIRNHIHDAFWLFDCTDGAVPNGDRGSSTVASQALYLLNSEFEIGCAEALAERALAAAPADRALVPTILWRRVLGRHPTAAEARLALDGAAAIEAALADEGVAEETRRKRAWAAVAQALLAGNEFLFVR
ncbi:MAG: PSD1 and planctomycete cytochrome C domain-containing protein [Planctomycetaceae bacterium]